MDIYHAEEASFRGVDLNSREIECLFDFASAARIFAAHLYETILRTVECDCRGVLHERGGPTARLLQDQSHASQQVGWSGLQPTMVATRIGL